MAIALLGGLALAAGCNQNSATTVGGGNKQGGGNTVGSGAGACLHDEPGCACSHEGAVIQCGVALDEDSGAGKVKCATGGQICSDGKWGGCLTDSNDPTLQASGGLKLVSGVQVKNISPGTPCANDPCDPYCIMFPDTANGVDAGDGGPSTLGCGDASVLTVVTNGSSDAATAPAQVIKDAALADGEGYIFIQLAPSQTATRTFTTPKAAVTHADIYFLIDDTSSMGPAAASLASALTNPSGIIQEIKALLPAGTTDFGVGRFEDFFQLPYAGTPEPPQATSTNPYNLPYQNLLSLQTDNGTINPITLQPYPNTICNGEPGSCTSAAVSWLTYDAFGSLTTPGVGVRSGGDIPSAATVALWQMGTGSGLYYSNMFMGGVPQGVTGPVQVAYPSGTVTGNWWQVPRVWWQGSPMTSPPASGYSFIPAPSDDPTSTQLPPTGSYLPCGSGTVTSYPCFHQQATPVVVMLSDAPAHNGPGGQYSYVNEVYTSGSPHIGGANVWPYQPRAYPSTTTHGAYTPPGGPALCPTQSSYDAPIVTGSGAAATAVCSLTNFTASPTQGLSFANALPLPTDTAGLPVQGVYYGYVPATYRAPDTTNTVAAPANWFSSSSVGGGVFNVPAIPAAGGSSPFLPGGRVRNSLRDCSAGDEGFECTPGVNTPGAPNPTCWDNTTGGHSLGTAVAAATITYTPTATTSAASTHASIAGVLGTEPAIGPVGPTLSVIDPGGPSAVTVETTSNAPATASATSSAPETTTNATYTPGMVQTATANQTILAGTCTTALIPNIAIPAGQEITNLSVTVDNIGQNVIAAISAYVVIGGANYLTTPGSVSTLGGSSTSTSSYYAGSAATTGTITVAQAACASQTGSPYGIVVTVTYQLATPNACPNTGPTYSLLQTASAGSTSPTDTCIQCTGTGSTWNGTACTSVNSCSSGTLGTGLNGSSTSLCYTCPTGTLVTTTAPWTCSLYRCTGAQTGVVATNANTGNGAATNASVNTCYYCSNATNTAPTTGSPQWTCPYSTCANGGAVSTTTHSNVVAGDCYTCSYTNANVSGSPVAYAAPTTSTTANWTCPTVTASACAGYTSTNTGSTMVSNTWTQGTGVGGTTTGTCYNCPALAAPSTTNTLDTSNTNWQCSSCNTTTMATDVVLDTSTAPYECTYCATGTLTAGGTNTGTAPKYGTAPTCNVAGTCTSGAAYGFKASGTTCTVADACASTYTGAMSLGFPLTITNNTTSAPTGGWAVACGGQNFTGGISECSPDTTGGAGAAASSCYLLLPSSGAGTITSGNAGCTCQLETVTGATAYNTTTNNPCGAATPALSNPANSGCSTTANGSACTLSTTACTAMTGAAAGAGYVSCQTSASNPTPACTSGSTTDGGDGYYGNDIIYKFVVPGTGGFTSRYYYHFAILAQGPDATSGWLSGAAKGSTGPAVAAPFLYIKAATGTTVNTSAADLDSSYPFTIPASAGAADDNSATGTYGGTVGLANGNVIDCNKSAHSELIGPSPTNDSYVLSEIDGYLPQGTYYLVIDNGTPTTWTDPPAQYQYFLQIGGFDDTQQQGGTNPATYTSPSYDQMISVLAGMGAKFVGVDNTGISCLQAGQSNFFTSGSTSAAQFETRDFMEKVAVDLGSLDTTTSPARAFVVPVAKSGATCNPAPPLSSLPPSAGGTGTAATATSWCQSASNFTANQTGATQSINQGGTPQGMTYDTNESVCTPTCSTNNDCPMNAPTCSSTACTTGNCCTTGCAGGIAGLSCAVAAAVSNLTSNLKQNVYIRPLAVGANQYVAPGVSCTPTALPSPASAACSVMGSGGPACYGGTCTSSCTAVGGCSGAYSGFICEPSSVPNDPNYGYCVAPEIFIKGVTAVSTDTPTAMPMTGSDAVCGLHPLTTACTFAPYPMNGCPSTLPTCLTAGPGAGTCGIPDTGPDTVAPLPAYYVANSPPQDNDGMFNLCSPGAQVNFNVTFIMPFQRSVNAQQYEFDLGIFAGAGLAGRTRVILENPALAVVSFYRDYDSNAVCPSGTHVVWGNFTYNAVCPSDGTGDYSQIKFCATAAATAEAGFTTETNAMDSPGGCAPGEVLLWIATADPSAGTANGHFINTCPSSGAPGMQSNCAPVAPNASTPSSAWSTCEALTTSALCGTGTPPTSAGWNIGQCQWLPPAGGVNVGTLLAAYAQSADAGVASDRYLRVRMEFDPSTPGDVVAPFLYNWNLDIDCRPSE